MKKEAAPGALALWTCPEATLPLTPYLVCLVGGQVSLGLWLLQPSTSPSALSSDLSSVVSSCPGLWTLQLPDCGPCHPLSQVMTEEHAEQALEILTGPVVWNNLPQLL